MITKFSGGDNQPANPGKAWRRWFPLAAGVLATLLSGSALADSRSSLVFVSVRVVDSCRVNATEGSNSVDVNMRCTSAARPSVRMENQGASLVASEGGLTGSKPVSSISLARTGDQVLRIDF